MELTHAAVPLPAHEAEWSRRLREDPHLLWAMAASADGPFHVLHPGTFIDNARAFQEALAVAGVEGQVMYGAKANRSPRFLQACAATGAGADVASVPELTAALAAGLRGRDLVVTGPAKSAALLDQSLRHGALVAVDALDELRRLLAMARDRGRARVVLRVLPGSDPSSRFGLDAAALEEAMSICADTREAVGVEGFSFHLSGYEVAPRTSLAVELVQRCRDARAQGLEATSISIGGGFGVDYVPAPDWDAFLAGQEDSWFHADRRPSRFYPYHQQLSGADMLAAVLAGSARSDYTLAETLTRAGVRLLLEPGRALLDRSGLSVFTVQGYKTRCNGMGDYGIITVDGLSMSLSEQWKGSEFLPDPVLWPPAADQRGAAEPVAACVGGTSCLEYDMLTWRKVAFPRPPQFGDLLIYPNTAGYQMDKNESRFHGLSLPKRFVVEADREGALTWGPTA